MSSIWQLDVFWADDGPDHDETGRETLHQFPVKPSQEELIAILKANRIYCDDADKLTHLLQGDGVLMNSRGESCDLTEVTTP